MLCCISFDSYIKPQPRNLSRYGLPVVYLLIPTSNHNWLRSSLCRIKVVYLLIPTSNHNYDSQIRFYSCCISFDSYIKPQPDRGNKVCYCVVYLLIPTSNHNLICVVIFLHSVVYLLIPTSNHN